MYNNFNYQVSIEKIKSALYDIYENQEVMIGEEQDNDSRNNRVENYIKTKDLAVQLIEKINSLYNSKNMETRIEKVPSEPQIVEPQIIKESKQDELLKESNQIEDVGTDDFNDVNVVEQEQIQEEQQEKEKDAKELTRFYLDSRNGDKPNFAFVPNSIFSKLKENGVFELINNIIYKQDTEERRGIIVRKDQFMKLSLSKDRQEGVLVEAKQFRIKQAKKSREILQNV